MRRAIGIGLIVSVILALSVPAFSAEKNGFFGFLKKTVDSEQAEVEAKPPKKVARPGSATRIKAKNVYDTPLYSSPEDPNRFIVRVPQAPKPPVRVPRTDLLQKAEKKEISR